MTVDELLKLWGKTRAPEVSEALDRLSPRLPKPLYPKSAASEVRQTRWLEAAATVSPANVATLLDTLHDGFSDDVRKRLEVITNWGDDPRISSSAPTRGH